MKTKQRAAPRKAAASMTNYSITLPADLLRRLDAVVERKISSRSRETRDALIEHLKREEGDGHE